MKRSHYFLITALLVSSGFFAQTKLLTIQEALLKGRTTLAPKRIQTMFVPGEQKFAFIDNNVLKVGNNDDGQVKDLLSLGDLNKQLKSSS
ncbi:MAG: hypothetical protein ACXVNQ_01320, partial [Bacteroidia bacterium]